jgi:flagellar M-ring protein FliF
MGFLNQSIVQVRDLFASMTPAARITAVLLLAVIGVSLGYLFQDFSGGAKEQLFHGDTLTAGEANAIQAAIATASLTGAEREGNQIFVPRGQKDDYLAAIANAGALPANLDTLLLDESADLGLFTDRRTRDDRMKAMRERMLSMIIRKMDGVQDANVLFDIRESKGLNDKRLVTATVGIRPTPGEELTARRVKMIQKAVAGATPGLNPKDVAILNYADGSQYDGSNAIDSAAYDGAYFQTKITYEEDMKKRIEEHLRYIPGVRVQVTAELDDTLNAETRSVKSTGEIQTIHEQNETALITDKQVDDQGRPGLTAQGPGRTGTEESVATNEHSTDTNSRDTTNFVPVDEDARTMAGLVPKDVRASIIIPSDYLVSVWRERNPDAAADDRPPASEIPQLLDIEKLAISGSVALLLPRKPTDDPYDQVTVTMYQSLTPPPVVEPSTATLAMVWASANSGTLIMAGLAMVSLVMLRSMVKSIPAAETNVFLQTPGGATGVAGFADEAGGFGEAGGGEGRRPGEPGGDFAGSVRSGNDGRPRLKLKKGPSLKDDLTDMVRDDPDAAAAILRTWISSAG